MKVSKKKVLKMMLCILVFFILINICWYAWRMEKYEVYNQGMEENAFSTWIVPRYAYTDVNGYDYSVKYPNYLSFTGNLCVGLPTKDDYAFSDCLIIWPRLFGGYDYGVILSKGDESFSIYINADGSAVYPEDSEVVARNQEGIDDLLSRAKEMWNLE